MADALVTIAVEGILKKVLSIAAGELAIAWGYEKKLTSLHRTLDLIRAKMRDAERQKGTEAVMVWLKQLRDVLDEADDLLDEVHYEMLSHKIKKEDQVARKVSCLPCLKRFSFRNEMGHKIKSINETLLEINTQANILGLQNEHSAVPVPDRLYRETVPHLEVKIFGRDHDELRIIQLLTQSRKEEKLTIVPIVGMGGIGKTALAKSIYNDKKIEQHFDLRTWLCVSVKLDINILLAKIYESFAGRKPKSNLKVNLIKSLEEVLASKRYLLVLDDVWDEEGPYWEDFQRFMLHINSKNGSGILVTTRKLDVGTTGMKTDSCPLEGLSDDHCWDIFRERAFMAGKSPPPELENIGRQIVKKCGGLPLLLNVIGGMLANYNDKEKWLSIKNSKVWDLEEESERVQKSLELSFDNLPSSIVQQCFAYCCIFEKDTLMKREELVQLWMALGLVQEDDTRKKEMEDVGNDIFQILVSNSLFQDVDRDEFGYVTGCRMHDLVHDLSLSLSTHESLCMVDANNDDIARIPKKKHLAFYQERNTNYKFKPKISILTGNDMAARSLHTLFFSGEVEKNVSFQRFKSMRILKLKKCSIVLIDDSIGDLVHLRYLDLSYTDIVVLPESIGKLYHLQTLKFHRCHRVKHFPEVIRTLTSLRYVKSDESIPADIAGLLTSLRTLPSFNVLRQKGHQIEELGRLKHLRGKLCISNLENVCGKEDAIKADLSGKKNLYEIEFIWSRDKQGANRNDKDVLEGMQPPGDVKSLTIHNFSGENFPEWVMNMGIYIDGKGMLVKKLVKITLSDCSSCLSLPTLEHLPNLRDLVLEYMDNLTFLRSSLGECDNVTGSTKPLSPSLRSLRLYGMKRLEKWIVGATNSSKMLSPVLERLEISNCPKISFIDECHTHPLVSLAIWGCTDLVSIKSIQGLTCLESLEIDLCPSLSVIANFPNQCHSLKSLQITNCNKLTSLPREIFDCFPFLNKLSLGPFSKELDSFPSLQGIEKLRNHLHSLQLSGWDHLKRPEEIQHLTSRTQLTITGFRM